MAKYLGPSDTKCAELHLVQATKLASRCLGRLEALQCSMLAWTSRPPSFRVLMTASTELLPSVRLKVSLALRCTLTIYFVPARMQLL